MVDVLGVNDNVVVPLEQNSYLPDLLNTGVINPLCDVIDSRGFIFEEGELLLENFDNIGLDNGDVLGYAIVEEI